MNNKLKISTFIIQLLKFFILRILTWHFKHESTGVLIIRNDHLGDLLISLPLIEQTAAIAHRNSQSITVVTSGLGYELLKECAFIDSLIVCEYSNLRSGFLSRIREYRKITRYRAEKVVLLLSLGRFGENDYCALLPRSKQYYAIETMDVWSVHPQTQAYRKNFFNIFYSSLVDYDIRCTIRENEAKLLSAAMGENIYPQSGNIDFLGELPPCQVPNRPFFIVVPGGYGVRRQWPAKRFAAVVDSILEKYPFLTAVISGNKKDELVAEELMSYCRFQNKIINYCGKSTLMQLFSNVKNAEFILTNDTGTLHVAGMLDKRCFCVGGNWHYGAYNPDPCYKSNIFINADTSCKYCFENCHLMTDGRYFCLMKVTVEKVIETIFQNIDHKISQ